MYMSDGRFVRNMYVNLSETLHLPFQATASLFLEPVNEPLLII